MFRGPSNLRIPGLMPQFGQRHSASVGPAWYDSFDGSLADTDDIYGGSAERQPVTAGQTGMCTKVRFWIGFNNGGGTFKVALYDGSLNLLSTGSATLGAGPDNSWFEVPIMPVAVVSGSPYSVAWMRGSGVAQSAYRNGAGTSYIDFGVSYAAFPQDPFASGGDVGWSYPAGIYIE